MQSRTDLMRRKPDVRSSFREPTLPARRKGGAICWPQLNERRPKQYHPVPDDLVGLRETSLTGCLILTRRANQLIVCPAPFAKIFWFSEDPNHFYIGRCPAPLEGRHAIVTAAGRDAVDAEALLTNSAEADGEVVWS
jgi:hypothetical protein